MHVETYGTAIPVQLMGSTLSTGIKEHEMPHSAYLPHRMGSAAAARSAHAAGDVSTMTDAGGGARARRSG